MNSDRFELRDVIDILHRRRKVIYYTIVLALVSALLINTFAVPLYESTVTLRVTYYRGPNETVVTMAPDDLLRQQIFTYLEIIKSRTVVQAVIDKICGTDPNKPSYGKVVQSINTRLISGTQILAISVMAGSPEEAQLMTNTLLEEFLARLTDIVRSQGKEARVFIAERMEEVKKNLENTEKSLVKYKKEHRAVSVTDQTKSLVGLQADLQKMFVDNQLDLEQSQAKLASVNRQINSQHPGFIADSPQIEIYRTKLAEQEVELVTLRQSFRENHPKVASLQVIIAETKRKLNVEISRVANAEAPSSNIVYQNLLQNKFQAETDVAVARAKNSALNQAGYEQEKEMKLVPDKEQGLAQLMRDYTVADEAYNTLAKRYEQARIDEVTQPTNVQVIDRADLPSRPSRPRSLLNVLVALVMGLCGGVVLAFLLDYFYKTIDTPGDITKNLGIRVIGSIANRSVRKPSLWRRLINKFKHRDAGGC